MTVLKTGHIQIYMTDGWIGWIGWIGSQTAIAARASLNRAVLTRGIGEKCRVVFRGVRHNIKFYLLY